MLRGMKTNRFGLALVKGFLRGELCVAQHQEHEGQN